MAEAKLIAWLFYGLGIPVYLYAMFINVTTWKSHILFILALVIAGVETYWKIRRNQRADRKAAQEEMIRELEIERLRHKK